MTRTTTKYIFAGKHRYAITTTIRTIRCGKSIRYTTSSKVRKV